MATPVILDEAEYLDRVRACWMGKAIGGTLGGPHECKTHVLDLDFYRPVPDESAPNDDLDLQLVWLVMLEQTGLPPRLSDLADWWIRCCSSYPWNEYGFCRRNLGRGLRPPVAGCFENYYVDEMGSPIRSEIWACLAPGNPQLAAAMAWKDSALDHAGGEGMYGEMFWAAVESAAFVEHDPMALLRVGLNMIPVHSQISRAVREAIWCSENGVSWADARNRVVRGFAFGSGPQPCHASVNHGFTVLGWLYGEDFGSRLCRAVNCAFDTDCTGATLGSLLGILEGTGAIPPRWSEPVGDAIVLHKFTDLPNSPRTIGDLAERTAALARSAAADPSSGFAFGDGSRLPDDVRSRLMLNDLAAEALRRDPQSAIDDSGELEVTFHYCGEPVLRPRAAKTVGVSLAAGGVSVEGRASLSAPEGVRVEEAPPRLGQTRFTLRADEVPARLGVAVDADAAGLSRRCEFTILGPAEAAGFPAVDNVAKCPRCMAWEGACICDRSPG